MSRKKGLKMQRSLKLGSTKFLFIFESVSQMMWNPFLLLFFYSNGKTIPRNGAFRQSLRLRSNPSNQYTAKNVILISSGLKTANI